MLKTLSKNFGKDQNKQAIFDIALFFLLKNDDGYEDLYFNDL